LVRTASCGRIEQKKEKTAFLTEKKLASAELCSFFHAAAEEHWKSSRSPVDARCFACCRAGRSGSNFWQLVVEHSLLFPSRILVLGLFILELAPVPL